MGNVAFRMTVFDDGHVLEEAHGFLMTNQMSFTSYVTVHLCG